MNEQTIQIAYNPITRKFERVYEEDEVPAHKIITLYWSGTLEKYVTIPE